MLNDVKAFLRRYQSTLTLLAGTLLFDIYWILVAHYQQQYLTLWVGIAVLSFILLVRQSNRLLCLGFYALGLAIDGLWVFFKGFAFANSSSIPLWIASLWLVFAVTWIKTIAPSRWSYPKLAILGAIAGPISYFAGVKFNAITINAPLTIAIVLMASQWALLMTLAQYIYNQVKPLPSSN